MRAPILCILLITAACGGGDDVADGWRGDGPHVDVRGELDGTSIDLQLDEASAGDLARAFCKREYLVPDATDPTTWADGTMPELEVTVRVTEDGLDKQFELGFTAADFSGMEPGTVLAVVPPVDGAVPAAGVAWFEVEWQWEDPDTGFVDWEGSATGGTLELALMSGEIGDDGVVPDGVGALGLWFDATWDAGALAGSLTVSCGANEVE